MNLFSAITSWIGAYNALSNTQTGQNLISKWKQAIAPVTQPIQKAFTPAIETAKQAISPITSLPQVMTQKRKPTFFSDEQDAYDKMMADNVPEQDAIEAIKSRRLDLLGGNNDISAVEQQALKSMQADGMSAKEAAQALLDHRQSMQEEAKKRYESMGTGEKLVKWAVGASLGAVSTIGSSAENILGWGAKKLGFDALGEDLQKSAQEWKKASEELWKDEAYSAGVSTGNVIGGAGAMLAVPWPTWLLGKWAGLWSRILAGAGEWALQSTGMDIAEKWQTSVWSALTGAAVWWALPLVWAGISKAKKLITEKLPKSLISAGLMTPSKLLNASERLSRLADEGIVKADEAPQWMLDKWLKWSKETIQKQLGAIAKDAGKQKVQLFANDVENWVARTYESNATVQELQQALTEVLPNFAKITKDSIIPKAGNTEKVNALLEFITKPKPTALDIDKARAVLGDMGIFTKGGELADTATKEWLQKIWIDASKLLDESLPWFRALNKDIEVSNAMGKAMWLKEAQDSVRQLMILTNLGAGWAWAAYGYAQEWDVAGALKYAGAGLAGKYLFNNPAVTTFVAQKLKELWKEWLITKAIKSPATQRLIRWEAINLSK